MLTVGTTSTQVLVDFSGTAFGGTPVWTDITADVRGSITIGGGRQDWISSPSAASCSFTLDNHAGTYTVGNTSGPYGGNVRKGVRIRVVTTIASIQIVLFDGYSGAWVTSFDDNYGVCAVTATDITGRWANDTLRSFLVEEMLLDSPLCVYALQEPQGATSFADVTGMCPLLTANVYGGTVDAGQSSGGDFLAGTMVQVTNPSTAVSALLAAATGLLPTSAFTMEGWVQVGNPTSPAGFLFGCQQPSGTGSWAYCQMTPTGTVEFILGYQTATVATTTGICTSTKDVNDGNVHHVAATFDPASRIAQLCIDGLEVSVLTMPSWSAAGWSPFTIGAAYQDPFSGSFAFIGIYGSVLSSDPAAYTTRVGQHYLAGSVAFAGDTSDERFARLMSYRTNNGTIADVGLSVLEAADVAGDALQQALYDLVADEDGFVYVGGPGLVTFRSRSRLFNPTPVVTLDASLQQVDGPTSFSDDAQYLINSVDVTTPSGLTQTYTDQASVDDADMYDTQVELNLSDSDGLTMASWLVAKGTVTPNAAPTIAVDLATEPSSALALQVLQTSPYDAIAMTNLPAAAPATSLSYLMQGWSYEIGVGVFKAGYFASALPPAVVEIDGDAAHGINSTAIVAP